MQLSIDDEIAMYAYILDENNDLIPLVQRVDDEECWYETEYVLDTMQKKCHSKPSGVGVLRLPRPIRIYKKGLRIVFGSETPAWALELIPDHYMKTSNFGSWSF